jgi:hypothetical protein
MRKMLIVLISSAAIGAGAVASATPAAAFVPLIVPIAIIAGIGGVGAGAAIANANQPTTVVVPRDQPTAAYTGYYDSDAAPLPPPGPGCTVSHDWTGTHWHNVEICS